MDVIFKVVLTPLLYFIKRKSAFLLRNDFKECKDGEIFRKKIPVEQDHFGNQRLF